MLPEDWKKEIEEAVDKTTRAADEAGKRADEIQEKIARRIDAVADALNKYNEKQERETPRNRTQYRWTLLALGAAAVCTLGLDVLSGCQLREMRKVYGPINETAEATKRALENTDKPVLVIVMSPEGLAGITSFINSGQVGNLKITAAVENRGRMTAYVRELRFGLRLGQANLMEINNTPVDKLPSGTGIAFDFNLVLAMGDKKDFSLSPPIIIAAGAHGDLIREGVQKALKAGAEKVFLRGVMTYDDEFGVCRTKIVTYEFALQSVGPPAFMRPSRGDGYNTEKEECQ